MIPRTLHYSTIHNCRHAPCPADTCLRHAAVRFEIFRSHLCPHEVAVRAGILYTGPLQRENESIDIGNIFARHHLRVGPHHFSGCEVVIFPNEGWRPSLGWGGLIAQGNQDISRGIA